MLPAGRAADHAASHAVSDFSIGNYVAIVYQYAHAYRTIYIDGTKHLDGVDFWMGDSRGHWEGDTLVVDVTNFNDQTWLDAVGRLS